MVYRQTDKVRQRLAARHAAIIEAARDIAAEQGLAAVQVIPVAQRAGIAAGTMYRYFPGKAELVEAIVSTARDDDLTAMQRAAETAPGRTSGFVAVVLTLAVRMARQPRLTWALLAEAAEPDLADMRLAYRQALVKEVEARLGEVPAENRAGIDPALAAPALLGALLEALVGPLAPRNESGGPERVQLATLFALRGAGIPDGRARGLIVQTPIAAD